MSKKPINKTNIVSLHSPKENVEILTVKYVDTCSDCKFWYSLRDLGPDSLSEGQCRVGPPTVPTKIVEGGTVHFYRLTLPLYPACGQFQSRQSV